MRPEDESTDDLKQALQLYPGERIRATVCETPSSNVAVLGLLGFRVRVRCRRRVRVGDELLVEVGTSGSEVRLRCIESVDAPSKGGSLGLDVRV